MFLVAQAGQLFGDTEAAALPSLLESGRLPARISGLPASGRALLAASMHAQLDAPVLAVCPDEAAAELFQKDLTALLGQDVPLLTARDYTFYTVESVSRQTEQKRLNALYALAAGTAPAVVCTVSGLLQRAMPKEKLLQAAFEIRDGTSLPPEDAEDALLRCGYLRTAQVEGPGQFSRRGGILDFFSPAYPQPVRVEFWGDDVDSMGFSSTMSLVKTDTVFSLAKGSLSFLGGWYKLAIALAMILLAGAAMLGFLGTRLGLSIRATGDNAAMVRASSINPAFTITVGLCISGALCALSGGLLAQYQKSCDINVGTGMVTIALASLIIGETLLGKRTMLRRIIGVVFGSCLYRFIVAVALRFNVPAAAMKLVSAIIVAIAISMPAIKEKIAFEQRKHGACRRRVTTGKEEK